MSAVRHLQQEKPYSCAAACLAMVTGLPEKECRKLACTARNGTHMSFVAVALRELGHTPHTVNLNMPLDLCLWQLEAQSMCWPLILSCEFRQNGSTASGRRRMSRRQHAVVVWQGKVYDPGEDELFDADCIGHLGDRGITVNRYILIEPKT